MLASVDMSPGTEATQNSDGAGPIAATASTPAPRLCKKPLVGLSFLFLSYIGLLVLKLLTAQSMEERIQVEQDYQAYVEESEARELQGLLPLELRLPPMLDDSGAGAVDSIPLVAFCLLLSILMMAFAFRGITDIKRSEGRLYGLGLAIFVAWIPLVLLVDGAIIAMISDISDRDVRELAMPIAALVLLGLDILFMRWQYRRHAPR